MHFMQQVKRVAVPVTVHPVSAREEVVRCTAPISVIPMAIKSVLLLLLLNKEITNDDV
jgi:hypothetical protein